ncbi:sulfotransferase domain-containing protein [Rhodophyticola sp. MJ-SS7]|nr:sulfotransferase domain-containing protein [Rhodophyticola sp. MJ-SS7]
MISPALRAYSGSRTDPSRWAAWRPRRGDILVCTPSKAGTTWTQTMIAMLLNGGADLDRPLNEISPWIDADLGTPAEEVARDLDRQPGRRVVKTHTPGDGVPVWEGVSVVAVYRHPLDIFISLRNHALNMKSRPDHPMAREMSVAVHDFLTDRATVDDIDHDSVEIFALHYRETVASGRFADLVCLHYADMVAAGPAIVAHLDRALRIGAGEDAIARVAEATTLAAMRDAAARYVPASGKGFWHDEAAFFHSGGTEKWAGLLSEADLALYEDRMAAAVPDPELRRWLERGSGRL